VAARRRPLSAPGGSGDSPSFATISFDVEVEAGRIAGMYEYATWTAKGPGSGWGDVAFAREAFPTTVIPYDEARFADVAPTG
jgi:hypothetical protein